LPLKSKNGKRTRPTDEQSAEKPEYGPMEANTEMRRLVLAAKTPKELCKAETWSSTKWYANGDEKVATKLINDRSLTPYEHCNNIGSVNEMANHWWNWLAAGIALLGLTGLALNIRDWIKQRRHEKQMERTARSTSQEETPITIQQPERTETDTGQDEPYRSSFNTPAPGEYSHLEIDQIIRSMTHYSDNPPNARKWKGGVRVDFGNGQEYYLNRHKEIFRLERGRIFTKKTQIMYAGDIPTSIIPYVNMEVYRST